MPYLSEAHRPDSVVTVEGLTFSYGSRQVLHGISFTLRKWNRKGTIPCLGSGECPVKLMPHQAALSISILKMPAIPTEIELAYMRILAPIL